MTVVNVLIVEDEMLVARDLEYQLQALGFGVAGIAASGDEALALTQQARPDIVLMDIRLHGGMDGIAAADQIRKRFHLPVIYLTAHADDSTVQRARATEPFGYLIKPFEERELKITIDMALYKHQAERRLRASERRYATTLGSIGDAVIATDQRGRITFMNAVAEELTGYRLSEATTRPLADVFRTIQEGDGQPRPTPQGLNRGAGCNGHLVNHALLINREGRGIPIEDCAAPIQDEEGESSGIVLVFRDVTEKRQVQRALELSEARFKAFMENSPIIALMKDEQGHYVYVNRAWQQQFPEPMADWAGKTDFDMWPEATARLFRASDEEALASAHTVETRETGATPAGELTHWISYKFPVRDLSGQRLLGGLVVDVTRQKKLEEQLFQAQKMESIGRLAGGVAHDFNNMLTAINGNCSLLLRAMAPDHPWYEILRDVLRAGERAADLTRQLLAFSRKQMLQPRLLDLNQIVTGLEKMLARAVGDDIELRCQLESELGPVRADPGQLEHVLLNLVLNARDAMPDGGSITIATAEVVLTDADRLRHSELLPGHYRALTVRDTGRGMEDRIREQVFEPFFTTKEFGTGTGMGLATVYGIVKQTGGHIVVDSAIGTGTTFTVYLPAASPEVVQHPVTPTGLDLARGTETILVVEDEEGVRGMIRRVLGLCGYVVLEAGHGAEALEASEHFSGRIELLISDVVMPHMSGPDLASQLRQRRPGLRVLYISGYPELPTESQSALGRNESYLQKPFTPSALADKVREVLSKPPV